MKTLRPSCKKCVLFELTLEMFKEAGITVPEGFEGISDDCDAFTSVDADVVEVVRCKDCAVPHNKWLGCPNLNGKIPPPDFYCARGERKSDNGSNSTGH